MNAVRKGWEKFTNWLENLFSMVPGLQWLMEQIDNLLLRSGLLCFPFRHMWRMSSARVEKRRRMFSNHWHKVYVQHLVCMKCRHHKTRVMRPSSNHERFQPVQYEEIEKPLEAKK